MFVGLEGEWEEEGCDRVRKRPAWYGGERCFTMKMSGIRKYTS